mmetsp:Transcript_19929/g.49471  ORF Transcript_19929/g.49471 Transcript_19929/m.49471 type:complete len:400 (+) Transcript_19929:315-1514(+)
MLQHALALASSGGLALLRLLHGALQPSRALALEVQQVAHCAGPLRRRARALQLRHQRALQLLRVRVAAHSLCAVLRQCGPQLHALGQVGLRRGLHGGDCRVFGRQRAARFVDFIHQGSQPPVGFRRQLLELLGAILCSAELMRQAHSVGGHGGFHDAHLGSLALHPCDGRRSRSRRAVRFLFDPFVGHLALRLQHCLRVPCTLLRRVLGVAEGRQQVTRLTQRRLGRLGALLRRVQPDEEVFLLCRGLRPDGCGLSIERGFVFCQELRPRRLFVQLRRLPLPHCLGLSLRLVERVVLLQEARDAFIRLLQLRGLVGNLDLELLVRALQLLGGAFGHLHSALSLIHHARVGHRTALERAYLGVALCEEHRGAASLSPLRVELELQLFPRARLLFARPSGV